MKTMTSGRYPAFTPEQIAEFKESVLAYIQNKGTLLAWCRIEGNPSYNTVYEWMDEDEYFAEDYRRARSIQGHRLADEIVELGRTESDVQRAALLVSAYKWAAPKFNLEYSERATTDIINSDGSLQDSPEKIQRTLVGILEIGRASCRERV
jgi:hypothetical protein